ncbi:MAG: glycosyltransferase family 4 protein [Patescibacteria group bacterium]
MTSEDLLPWRKKFKLLLNLKTILSEVRKADLIHAFDVWPYGLLAVLIGSLTRKPVILTAVGTGSIKKLTRWPYSILMRLTLKMSDQVTAISSYVKDKITVRWPNLKISVICPGVHNDYWRQLPLSALDNRLVSKNYILSVGTFKKRKGYDISLRVFKDLLRQYPDLYYVIVGQSDSSYYREIKEMIKKDGLDNHVLIMAGLTDEELRVIYRGSKLFMLLSRNDNDDIEGFGQVFLEAAAAGVPVLGGRGSGADDAIDNGVNGYLIDPENEEALVAKASEILNDEELRNKLSRGSLAFAHQMDWANKIQDYVKLYESR